MISREHDLAEARGVNVRLWDFLFYASFGLVVTSSVEIAGVLLVFCFLIGPGIVGVLFGRTLKARLLVGWSVGWFVSIIGCIITVSSGLSRTPGPGFVAHSSAKSALDAFTKSLALELGPHGVRVNTVAPGLTETDATAGLPEEAKEHVVRTTPMRRVATPEDIAGAVLLVASDHARFVSGNYIAPSGGIQMP